MYKKQRVESVNFVNQIANMNIRKPEAELHKKMILSLLFSYILYIILDQRI